MFNRIWLLKAYFCNHYRPFWQAYFMFRIYEIARLINTNVYYQANNYSSRLPKLKNST